MTYFVRYEVVNGRITISSRVYEKKLAKSQVDFGKIRIWQTQNKKLIEK